MLNHRQIEQLIKQEEHPSLVRRIMGNGRATDPQTMSYLLDKYGVTAAALGLALQRLDELTYGRDPLSDTTACRLCTYQRKDGLFGLDKTPSLLCSAVALHGLISWYEKALWLGANPSEPLLIKIGQSINLAHASLQKYQAHNQLTQSELSLALQELKICNNTPILASAA